jgi:hypothetical protein
MAEKADRRGVDILIGKENHGRDFYWAPAKLDVLSGQHIHGVLHAGPKVGWLQVGVVVPGDLVNSKPLTDQFQDALHGNVRIGLTRLSEMDLGVDGNSISHISRTHGNTCSPKSNQESLQRLPAARRLI